MIRKFFRGHSRSGLLRHDRNLITMDQKRGSDCAIGIRRCPLISCDLVELHFQQRTQEILEVIIIIDFKRRTVVSPKSELAGDGVKAKADFSDEIEWILVECGLNHASDAQTDCLFD